MDEIRITNAIKDFDAIVNSIDYKFEKLITINVIIDDMIKLLNHAITKRQNIENGVIEL